MLTETLDSIPVDEDGLPSFEALADGDVTNASDRSCPSSPDGSPRTPEAEEPSLVRPPCPRDNQAPARQCLAKQSARAWLHLQEKRPARVL